MSPCDAGRRILLVDDEQVLRLTFKHMLEEAGYAVSIAGDGKEGLVLCREFLPHVVIMDILMPVMDGFTTMGRIHSEFPHVPIIAISAALDNLTSLHAERCGAKVFLGKPVTVETLLLHVSRLCAE